MSDIGLFTSIDYIAWLIAGLVLCAAETIMPGAFLIWIGAAALILGVVEFFLPLEFTAQLLLFAALVVALVVIGRRVYGSIDRGSPPQPLSRARRPGRQGILPRQGRSNAALAISASTTASGA